MKSRKIRTALVGCGEIADAHLKELSKMQQVSLVAVCDLFEYLLRDTADRFKIPAIYLDFREMMDKEKVDVVHICTPPSTHFSLARIALEKGVNLYLEKPVTLTLKESEELALIKQLVHFPSLIEGTAEAREPLWISNYLKELCSIFHSFYTKHRVRVEEKGLREARLALLEATRIVIHNGLALLGVSSPNKM